MKLTPDVKKALVRFIAGGVVALLIKKAESIVNEKADKHFSTDETPAN